MAAERLLSPLRSLAEGYCDIEPHQFSWSAVTMSINRRTVRLIRELLTSVGAQTDDVTRTLAWSWVKAWDGLAGR